MEDFSKQVLELMKFQSQQQLQLQQQQLEQQCKIEEKHC